MGDFLKPIGDVFHVLFYLPVYNVLMVIYEALNNIFPAGAFAIAIVILTLIIRAALIPLTRKQLQSTRKMQMIQPELKAIQQRHRGDPQTLMAEQRRLYKENGVSMYGGCLPLLVQMPFLYALYYSFFAVLSNHENLSVHDHLLKINNDLYPFVPHLSTLPHTQFLWTNLAAPDPWHILPVVAAILTFIQMRMAMPVRKPRQPGDNPDPTSQAMNTTQYIMPVITLFFGWTFPAGLALYWCISTGFSAVQQYFINGNWGSLFVGIPGMEHLVPPPKDITPTVTRPAVAPAGARALTSASPPATDDGRPRGLFQRFKENFAAAQTQAQEQMELARQEREAAAQARQQAADGGGSGKSAVAPQRRQRPSREAPKLVKPSQPAEATISDADEVDEAILQATDQRELPEERIANGTNGMNGGIVAHSTGSAAGTNGANGANGGNKANKTTGTNGASGARPAPSGGSSAARRNKAKGGSGAQSRGGHSKRGR